MDLAASTNALSPHVKINCAKISYTSLDEPSPLTTYEENPSSTRDAADKRRSYIKVGAAWRKEMMFSSEDYGKSRLTPSSMSDLEMLTRVTTSMRQWIISCLVGIRKRKKSTVSTDTSNIMFLSICLLSGWHDREGGSSRLMMEKIKESISHIHGWVNGIIAISVARSYSRMICGNFLPIILQDRDPYRY